jgi:hypothetical protein
VRVGAPRPPESVWGSRAHPPAPSSGPGTPPPSRRLTLQRRHGSLCAVLFSEKACNCNALPCGTTGGCSGGSLTVNDSLCRSSANFCMVLGGMVPLFVTDTNCSVCFGGGGGAGVSGCRCDGRCAMLPPGRTASAQAGPPPASVPPLRPARPGADPHPAAGQVGAAGCQGPGRARALQAAPQSSLSAAHGMRAPQRRGAGWHPPRMRMAAMAGSEWGRVGGSGRASPALDVRVWVAWGAGRRVRRAARAPRLAQGDAPGWKPRGGLPREVCALRPSCAIRKVFASDRPPFGRAARSLARAPEEVGARTRLLGARP